MIDMGLGNRMYTDVEITKNEKHNGIEVKFALKPNQDVLDYLRARGWRWSSYKYCWYHFYSQEHLNDAEYVKNRCSAVGEYLSHYRNTKLQNNNINIQERPKEYKVLTDERISSQALIIRKHSFSAKERSSLEEVCAVFYVVKYDGAIIDICAPAFHLEGSNDYYIFDEDFISIENYGTPLCRRVDYDVYVRQRETDNDYSHLAEEGLLHSLGYNVDARVNLSEEQRHGVLAFAIESGFMSKDQVISFLDWLAHRGRNNYNLREAISKWREDRSWISQWQLDDKKRFIPDTIIEKHYIKYK